MNIEQLKKGNIYSNRIIELSDIINLAKENGIKSITVNLLDDKSFSIDNDGELESIIMDYVKRTLNRIEKAFEEL